MMSIAGLYSNTSSLYAVDMTATSLLDATNTSTTTFSSSSSSDVAEVAESLQMTRIVVQSILTPAVVIIGLLGNVLNILVLFQPSMRTSTNVYLLVLSIADSVYLVCNFALSILDCRKKGLTDLAYHFNPYGRFVSNFSGNVAVWVTVVFTVERYVAVCHPIHGKIWCTVHRAKLASCAVAILALINTLPTMFEFEVVNTQSGLRCSYTEFAQSYSYEIGYSWWYVTVFTFVPLLFLTIFNIVLIQALLQASRKRQKLVMVSACPKQCKVDDRSSRKGSKYEAEEEARYMLMSNMNSRTNDVSEVMDECFSQNSVNSSTTVYNPSASNVHLSVNTGTVSSKTPSRNIRSASAERRTVTQHRAQMKRSREQNKVTLMLVTIVMIFLLCQLPWTALFLYRTYLSSYKLSGSAAGIKIAGNVCNLLGLINASVNFYLYSCFSKRFRKTLTLLMFFWRRKSHSPVIV